ncbi:NAD-dependent epimerase/dehydratase family protein [Mangrovibacterium diazotrophicum]|uniref:Nucleoside-diphosphate-sugar epimerase n=1 Tax=Mangrovibacterium diazotrophicum TaxID=1261403 RepID=A0A419W338_9BACT|nr:NAD(P)-dependent oxidoreductase [Mangrovibacterium diazotrophicum]RKD89844.1 nucleoside-diphosphate-sugar epimerase [Mangrovibacterium diazotrophicum]
MSKKIFLAGAAGAIGQPLSRLLIENGWKVYGTTRSEEKAALLQKMGVEPVVVDVYDTERLQSVLAEIQPEVVINQLTDLPYALNELEMTAALVRNARLRTEGTKNLVDAAVQAGCKRIIAQSISFIYDEGETPHVEEDPLLPAAHPVYGETAEGIRNLERQVLESGVEGIVLRYGLLYGPKTGFENPIAPASVHVEAAAKAAEIAVTKGQTGIYNVAEADASLSTEKATGTLGWNADWRLTSN